MARQNCLEYCSALIKHRAEEEHYFSYNMDNHNQIQLEKWGGQHSVKICC